MSRNRYLVALLFAVLGMTICRASVHVSSSYRFFRMPETTYYGGILSIAKDSVGRIWFNGYDALYMYDGDSYRKMNDKVSALSPNLYWSYSQVVVARDKNIYVGTGHGLLHFRYSSETFELCIGGNIASVNVADDGSIWMLRNNYVCRFDPRSGDISEYDLPERSKDSPLYPALIYSGGGLYLSSGGKLYRFYPASGDYKLMFDTGSPSLLFWDLVEWNGSWYGLTMYDGLFVYGEDGRLVKHYDLAFDTNVSGVGKKLYADPSGVLLAATQSGLFILENPGDEMKVIRSDMLNPFSLPNNSVWSIYPDPDGGGFWIGTYGGKLAFAASGFGGVFSVKAASGGLSHSIVSCFEEDAEGDLWIGTEGGGVNKWDLHTGRITAYTTKKGGLRSDMVKKIGYDRQGRLVVSTFNGGLSVYDSENDVFRDLSYELGFSLPARVYNFEFDGNGGLWMSDPDVGLYYADLESGRVEDVRLDYEGTVVGTGVETFFIDDDDNIWLMTHSGVYVVSTATREVLRHYYLDDVSYSVNNVCSYCVTSSGIWFGTHGGGVNRLDSAGVYSNFCDSVGKSLSGTLVTGILENTRGDSIYFSTDAGLYWLDVGRNRLYRSKIDSPSLCGAYYTRSCFRTAGGKMLFGGTDGFIMFDPSNVGSNTHMPKVFFTGMKVNDVDIQPGQEGSPLKKSLSVIAKEDGELVKLSRKQSNFEIFFSSDNYRDSYKNRYKWRMEGYLTQWSLLPLGQKSLKFFDLPPGKYTLQMQAANNDDLWGDDLITSLRIEVLQSPFLTVWAFLVYILLIGGASFVMWHYIFKKKELEIQLDATKNELVTLYKKKYVAGPSDIQVVSPDDGLMKKAMELVEKNMDNSEYDVTAFVSDMAVGRTILYQKIKSCTGMSVREFITDIRLKRAAQLLEQSEYTIAEVSFMTGFANPKYFSVCFKKRFGKTPSEFRSGAAGESS